jgi:uncharacterized membrane protein
MGGILTKFTDALWISFTSPEPDISATRVIIAVLMVFIVLVSCFFIVQQIIKSSSKDPRVTPANVALVKTARQQELTALATAKEGFTTMAAANSLYNSLLTSIPPSEQYLVNLCPLTASIGGYIGPLTDGVFDPEYYVQQALRAGIRSFILPVSMYQDDNKKPPNWPYSGKPAIVCRNSAGKILSLNGMSIRKFCDVLMIYKSQMDAQASEPILIYLDATAGYIPDVVSEEKKYVQFTSEIAKELKPLDPFRLLTISSYGSAVGGENQTNILTQIPLTDLKDKILVFTNFNITVGTKDAYSSIRPLLYDYVNFTYAPVTSATIGTGLGANKCSSIHLSDVGGSQVNWTDQARTSWMITAQDDFTAVPDSGAVSSATAIGIQAIPIPFFFTNPTQTQSLWEQWAGYAWQVKQPGARYTKPAPIVPQNPSTALNARVNDSLQPGQASIV